MGSNKDNWNFRGQSLSEVNWQSGHFLLGGHLLELRFGLRPCRGTWPEENHKVLGQRAHWKPETPQIQTSFLRGRWLNSRALHGMLEAKPRASKRQSEISIAQCFGDKISWGGGAFEKQSLVVAWHSGWEWELTSNRHERFLGGDGAVLNTHCR